MRPISNKSFQWLFLLFMVIFIAGCRIHPNITIKVEDPVKYVIRYSYQSPQGKQNGRIHWRFYAKGDNILFLSPLNQVLIELYIEHEYTHLYVPRRKIFWQGQFNELTSSLWGLDFSFQDISYLIRHGQFREDINPQKKEQIYLELDKSKHIVTRIIISHEEFQLQLKIGEPSPLATMPVEKVEWQLWPQLPLDQILTINE